MGSVMKTFCRYTYKLLPDVETAIRCYIEAVVKKTQTQKILKKAKYLKIVFSGINYTHGKKNCVIRQVCLKSDALVWK